MQVCSCKDPWFMHAHLNNHNWTTLKTNQGNVELQVFIVVTTNVTPGEIWLYAVWQTVIIILETTWHYIKSIDYK
jgi:hypothetical protein